MAETDIGNLDIGDFKNTITDYSVTPESIDGPQDQKETYYDNTYWTTYFGYYKTTPRFKSAVNAKARWTVGKGYTASELTELTLLEIKGNGKDTFNTILENCIRTYQIGGDSFAEIIRDKDGKLVNLKPLDPENIRIIANKAGIIIRYEQRNKVRGGGVDVRKFKPSEMFHLMKDRIGDEIHGTSLVPAVENIIKSIEEAMADYKKLLHRNVYPVRIWKLDTDDPAKIATFKAKADLASTQGENIFIPMGTVETELAGVPSNSTMSPLPWISLLGQEFYQATGVPMIVVGGSSEITEASAKIAYLAFEQTIEEEQLYIEEQVLAQLNLEIDLEFPATLQNELLSDQGKSESMQAATAEDTAVTNTGLTPEQGVQ
jgi:hypothetical protein|tara:strand:+ start:116 stop:1237 length:1122 start_codon:yes stop_codon:yes gene_type:complete